MEAPAGWRAATRRGAALPRKALPAAREAEEGHCRYGVSVWRVRCEVRTGRRFTRFRDRPSLQATGAFAAEICGS